MLYRLTIRLNFNFRMYRLGSSRSRPNEWERSSAYYSRLTLSTSTGINRPAHHYPQPLTAGDVAAGYPANVRLFRNELIDIGHSNSYYDLCKCL